ncbi:MAG TPA: DUF2069 domain-containing protein [Xanthomonadales bacterium]|nr:DUF2069 domain-containing protein [Xanthomonadales bacterium]
MSARIGAIALFALFLLQVAWHAWWLPPVRMPAWLVATLFAAPLALALALWAKRPARGLLVGGMLGLFYFCHGLAEAWADPRARVAGLLEAALVVALVAAPAADAIAARRARR